jgi:hypothetical protein
MSLGAPWVQCCSWGPGLQLFPEISPEANLDQRFVPTFLFRCACHVCTQACVPKGKFCQDLLIVAQREKKICSNPELAFQGRDSGSANTSVV